MVLVWLGSGTVRPHPRCSGLNKHINFGVCLFLTGVREVPGPSDTSTAIGPKRIITPTRLKLGNFGNLIGTKVRVEVSYYWRPVVGVLVSYNKGCVAIII